MARAITDFCVAAAVNDQAILEACLKRSHAIASGAVELKIYEGYASAAAALNAALDAASAPIAVLAHQDVYLPESWLPRLIEQIDLIERHDENWGVLGVFGKIASGQIVGRAWSTGIGRELGAGGFAPTPVCALDELVLIVRTASGLRFDEQLPGFHLYGTDVVLEARRRGMSAYVIDDPVIHNSRPVKTLNGAYAAAYGFMRKKWWGSLPAHTLVCDLTRSPVTLWRAQWRRMRALRQAGERRLLDSAEIAKSLGYE
jgi:hypothetical protein